MSKVDELKQQMQPGQVYRRAQLAQWSNAVDRHIKKLLEDGTLVKLKGGLYHYPKETTFGAAPAEEETLVRAFLKDDRFLITSPNIYNALGVGTTQLYNEAVVYNHKRHGHYKLGGRMFDFRVKPDLPETLSKEFLLVDLVNNLDRLAENTSMVKERVKSKIYSFDLDALGRAVRYYGKVGTKKFFADVLPESAVSYG
jgi:hypothetical protein